MATEMQYYESLPDYDDIIKYIEEDPANFQLDYDFPEFVPDYSACLVVDNVPEVGQEKLSKLTQMLVKMFSRVSPTLTEADIYMPFNATDDMTLGCCFIKFGNEKEAELALTTFQGFAIDKKHSFKVNMYSDIEKYKNISTTYVPSEPVSFKPRPDPTDWLSDSKGRDQFVIRQANETEISWANLNGEDPLKIYDGEKEKVGGKVWCESFVQWSPQGTYLATFHKQGVKLWGGNDFEAYGRYIMPNVEVVDFSPCENFLVTYRYDTMMDPNNKSNEPIVVWDVLSGQKVRGLDLKNPLSQKFQVQATVTEIKGVDKQKIGDRVIRGRVDAYTEDKNGNGKFRIIEGNVVHEDVPSEKVSPLQDPNRLKWSYDGKYLARLGCDIISIYELPSMQLLEKKSLVAKDILDFSWSPNSNSISYWSPAVGNHPALISIVTIPERTEIASRKIFDVSDGRMIWQNDGDYLCVSMTKTSGKKKTYVLMFFRMRDVGVPVEQLEFSEPILSLSWEPFGDRVAILHGESRSPSISFYSMSFTPTASTSSTASTGKGKGTASVKKELGLLHTLTGIQCNELLWCPAGSVIALAYFASDACIFELHDIDYNIKLAARRHDRCNRLLWDPSGRVLATCTMTTLRQASIRGQADDGYNFYSFQGTPLIQMKKEKLFQFLWRPRPKDLLSSDEKKKVVKNLKKYEKLFDKEDREIRAARHHALVKAKRAVAGDFLSRLKNNKVAIADYKKIRVQMRNGYDSDDDRNYSIEVLTDETIVSNKEILV